MLPKSVYETLPYMYLGGGMSEVVYFDSMVAMFSGVLFFVAGAMVWVMRSNHRRKDVEIKRKQHGRFPEAVYEFVPFMYLALGTALLAFGGTPLFYPSAALFVAAGAQTLIVRSIYRSSRSVAAVQS